ncbi:MAG: phosphoglycerate mutase [Burkholderiales bacterium RIFCSPHIGHO2_12_FULL_69_20]|nr:MAG: phosphoglycerate mutase [Burkholderiales bacterium RIFCSPHIGHO2_12_FULL_69_20]
MKACLVRHGETTWSITGQHTGLTDLALTPHGEAQSRSLVLRLQAMGITRVLVSPRLRARQTCELAGMGAVSEIEPDLAEWDYGDYEGRRSVDIRREDPDWNIWRDGCTGGESTTAVTVRADRLIARLAAMQGVIALFSHGQFGAALAARWIGLALIEGQHFTLHPASVSLLGIDAHHADRRVIELWNECPGATSNTMHAPAALFRP